MCGIYAVLGKDASKEVVLHLFGYNQVMYSRRKLLSNWSDFFKIDKKNTNVLTDRATKVKFRAMENEYGTVMYSDKIFNGNELLSFLSNTHDSIAAFNALDLASSVNQ